MASNVETTINIDKSVEQKKDSEYDLLNKKYQELQEKYDALNKEFSQFKMKNNTKLIDEKEVIYTIDKSSGNKRVKIDCLDEDPVIENQRYVCLSVLHPEGVKNTKFRGVKFRGAFRTMEEAKRHVKMLTEKQIDKYFHIFIGEGFKWVPLNPDPNEIKDQEYSNDELNKLMKARIEHEEKVKKIHDHRIEETKKYNDDANRAKNIKDRLKKELEKKQQATNEVKNMTKDIKTKNDNIKKLSASIKEAETKINEKDLNNKKLDGDIKDIINLMKK